MYSSFTVNTKSLRVALLCLRVAVAAIGCVERADSLDLAPMSLQTEPTLTLPLTTQEPWVVPEPETPTVAVGMAAKSH